MNAPIRVAQAGTTQAANEKVQVITLEKPAGGQAITIKTGFEGKVKLDFSKIADDRITIVRVGETAVIFFHDNKSTITLDPFFGSGNLPLANLEFDLGGNRIFTPEQIAAILPFSVYQGILPAAGEGGGDPQNSGADFDPAVFETLPPIILNELMPQEELPGIDFQADLSPFAFDPLVFAGLVGIVEEEHMDPSLPGAHPTLSEGNEDTTANPDADTDTPGNFDNITQQFVGQIVITGGSGAYVFSLVPTWVPITALFSQGDALEYSIAGNVLTGFVPGDPNRVVFTLEVSATGELTFTLFDQLDHPLADLEDILGVDFSGLVHVDDAGAGLSLDLDGITLNVIDDVPVLTSDTESKSVDEDDIRTNFSVGTSPDTNLEGGSDESVTENNAGNNDPAFVSGTLANLVSFGSDEHPEGTSDRPMFRFDRSEADVVAYMQSLALFSKHDQQPAAANGIALIYSAETVGGVMIITAYEPQDGLDPGATPPFNLGSEGNIVFELRIDQFTGNYEFRLFDELIHLLPPAGNGEDPVLRALGLDGIDFGAIVEAVDYDGDSVDLGDGQFVIKVIDDVPEADIDKLPLVLVQHDETAGLDSFSFFDPDLDTDSAGVVGLFAGVPNPGNDPDVDAGDKVAGAIGFASSVLPIVVGIGSNPGADAPPASESGFSLKIDGAATSGLTVTDGSTISLVQFGPNIVRGVVDAGPFAGQTAFAVHIDADTGVVSIAQYLSLEHPNDNNDDEHVTLEDSNLQAVYTIVDSDGDSDWDAVDIGDRIRFDDDGPKVEIESVSGTVVHDETPGDDGNHDVPGSLALANLFIGVANKGIDNDVPQDNGAIGYAQNTLAAGIDADYGSDGPGSGGNVSYSLDVNNGADSGLLTTDGRVIQLFQVAPDVVVGRYEIGEDNNPDANDPAAFAIHIDAVTGVVTVVQYVSIKHDDVNDHDEANDNGTDANDDPAVEDNPSGPANEPIQQTITNNALQLVATITDGDGDSDSDSFNIGNLIRFEDDGPTVTCKNIVANGSFEEGHNLVGNQWEIFTSAGAWVMGADGIPFEIQRSGAAGPGINAQHGSAFVELDSDTEGNPGINPPGDINPSSNTNATVQQTVTTEAGQVYELTFWYMPRPDDGNADSSSMEVLWNGAVVHSIDSSSAPAGWQQITLQVTATGANSVLGFRGAGQQNELGAFLDNVSLCQKGVAVDEDDLALGNSDVQDGDDLPDPSPVSVNGTLHFNAGADGLKSLNFASMHGGNVQTSGGTNVTANDAQLRYFWDAATSTLYASTNIANAGAAAASAAFMVQITNPATGAYTFTLLNAVDHPLVDDAPALPNKIAYEDNLDIDLTWTVVDGDDDFANGTLKVNIDDDVPLVASNTTNHIQNGDFQTGATPIAADFWGAAYNPGDMPGWNIAGSTVDPAGTLMFERSADTYLDISSSTNNGMTDLGASGGNYQIWQNVGAAAGTADDLAASQEYVIQFEVAAPFPQTALLEVLWNGTVIGTIDTNHSSGEATKYAFIVEATGTTGELRLREIGTGDADIPDDHPDDGPNDALRDETFHGTYVTNFEMFALNALVDEDQLTTASGDYSQGNNDLQTGDAEDENADGDGDATTAGGTLGIQWGADQYDTADAGGVQDGAGGAPGLTGRSVTFTDNLVDVLGVDVPLLSKGDTVNFVIDPASDGTVLHGVANDGTGDRTVFTVTLSDDGSGAFTFQLFDQLDHADGADENDIALKFNFTATDSDGDAAQGTFLVGVDDDVPVITGDLECIEIGGDEPQPGKVANFVFVLDTSDSVEDQFALLQDAANNLLDSIGGSGAEHVRVHVVEFNSGANVVGTYDLIVGGTLDGAALTQVKTDIDNLSNDGFTNYEAGLKEALLWIQGGTKTVAVTGLISSPDANGAGEDGNTRIIGNGATQIALVSGWNAPGNADGNLINANGGTGGGWGASPTTFETITPGELLRFDFGAFNDFGVGSYANAGAFAGIPVTSATFRLEDEGSGTASFSWIITFTDGATENDSENVGGDGEETHAIAGTGANLGKQIAHIQFSMTGGEGQVDLESVGTPVAPGTIPNADVNEVVFISDGEPNRALDDNGNIINVGVQDAIDQITGVDDTSDEIGETEGDGDGAGQDQAFNINAIGVNIQPQTLTIDSADDSDTDVNLVDGLNTGGSNDDDSVRLFSGATQVALVSGWSSGALTTAAIVDANGGTGGIGVEGGTDSGELSGTEVLRFDFGAGNDYDGGGTNYTNNGFNGPAVTSATFRVEDAGSGAASFSWTIHFVNSLPGTATESGATSFSGDGDETHVIAGTGANAGKEIAYIEFVMTGGEGEVDLQSVVTTALPGLAILDQIDTGGSADNITAPGQLTAALQTVIDGLAGGGGGGGDSANFDLGSIVAVGADEEITFSWKTDTTPLELQGLESGGTPLQYSFDGDTLIAHTGDPNNPVFTVLLNDDGTGTFTLVGTIDDTDGDADGELHIELAGMVLAVDYDNDPAVFGAGDFCVEIETGQPIVVTPYGAVLEEDDLPNSPAAAFTGNPDDEDADGLDTDEAPPGPGVNFFGDFVLDGNVTGGDGTYTYRFNEAEIGSGILDGDLVGIQGGVFPNDILRSRGEDVTLDIQGNQLVGYVINDANLVYNAGVDRLVFTFDINIAGGTPDDWGFALYDNLDHPTATSGGAATEENIVLDFDDWVIVDDQAGNVSTLAGQFTVIDDTPIVEVGAFNQNGQTPFWRLDETTDPDNDDIADENLDTYGSGDAVLPDFPDNNGDLDDAASEVADPTGTAPFGTVSNGNLGNFFSVTKLPGADGEQDDDRTLTLKLIAVGGAALAVGVGLQTTLEATQPAPDGNPDADTGDLVPFTAYPDPDIYLFLEADGTITGRVGNNASGPIALRITLTDDDPALAQIKVDQFLAIDHPTTPDTFDEELNLGIATDNSQGTAAGIALNLSVTLTDGDDDTDTDGHTAFLTSLIRFDDDGPRITTADAPVALLELDESIGTSPPSTGDESGDIDPETDDQSLTAVDGTGAIGVGTFDVSGLISGIDFGQDGGTAEYSLILKTERDQVGIVTPILSTDFFATHPAPGGNPDHNGGTNYEEYDAALDLGQIFLFQIDAQTIEGYVGENGGLPAGPLALRITIDDNGVIEFEQILALRHEDNADHDDAVEGESNILEGVLAKLTATDGDGDQASVEVPVNVMLEDDGPILTAVNDADILDDEEQDTLVNPGVDALGIEGGPGDDGALAVTTGTLNFDAGTDGLRKFEITSVAVGDLLVPLQAILVDPATGKGTTENVNVLWTQNPGDAGGTFTGTGVSGQSVFTLAVEADGDYTFSLFAPLAHSIEDDPETVEVETEFEDNISLVFGTRITDGDGDTAESTLVVAVDDDTPDAAPAAIEVSSVPSDPAVVGLLNFEPGADGWSGASLANNTPPPGLTSGGNPVKYWLSTDEMTLIGYTGLDVANGGAGPVLANQVFVLTVNPGVDSGAANDGAGGNYTFDLLQPVDAPVTQVLLVGGSSFGAGPQEHQVLTTGSGGAGVQLAVASGWNTDDATFDLADWQTNGVSTGETHTDINGSTAGWGVENNNFDSDPGGANDNEFMRFDFGALTDFDGGGSYTPPAGPLPTVSTATFEFPNFAADDDIAYVAFFSGGGRQAATIADPTAGLVINAPVGQTIDHVEFYAITGSGKIDLVSVAAQTVGGDVNLSFNLSLSDGDGDREQVALAVTVTAPPPDAAPIINAPDTIQYWSENTTSNPVTFLNRLSFQDSDGNATVRVNFRSASAADTWVASTLAAFGLTEVSNAGGVYTVEGTYAGLNHWLAANGLAWNPGGAGGTGPTDRDITVEVDANLGAAGGVVSTQVVSLDAATPGTSGPSTNLVAWNFNNVDIDVGNGNDTLTTSWSHGPSGSDVQYLDGTGTDRLVVVLTPAQLEALLSTAQGRTDLGDDFFDGDVSETLDLGAIWNATGEDAFDNGTLAVAAGKASHVNFVDMGETLPALEGDLSGEGASELLVGTGGANTITGGGGVDILVGLAGDDDLDGGTGSDLLLGGDGDDELRGGDTHDIVSGGSGADTFILAAGATNADSIVDYSFVDGDVLDISEILTGFDPGDPLSDFVQFINAGDTVNVLVDADGAGGAAAVNVATLWGYNTSGNDPIRILFEAAQEHTVTT